MSEASTIRILHLEDSPRDAELIHTRLAMKWPECDIVNVNDKEGFLAALDDDSFEIILTDYNLPGYDGLSALQAARERQPMIPVIVVSGSLGEEEAVKCLQMGATDYILKQRPERFVPAVERALQEADHLRKRILAEEELRKSQERFREQAELLDKAHDAIWVESLEGCITYWNKGAERLYGWTSDEALGRNALELLLCDDDSIDRKSRQLVLEKGEWDGESRHISKTGDSIDVGCHLTLILDSTGNPKCILSINTDITEKKNLAAQFLRKQRLESIGTLAGGLAHDLNNALAPILISIDLLRLSSPHETALLDTLETSTLRGAEMVRHLLTFAKGSECDHTLLKPQHLLEEISTIVSGTFPKTLDVHVNALQRLPSITGNATQLHQVLLNLCVNARDAMPLGGTLSVEADNVEIDEAYAETTPEAKPGSYVVFRVQDTGTGIPPEIIDRIFDPFFTTKGPNKGTGLGLSTVLGIVKSHSGFIEVRSEPGQGSVFAIYLPAQTKEAAPASLPYPDDEVAFGNGELILVVDDDASVRKTFTSVLTALNYRVIAVADGAEALIVIAEKRQELRAVIVDLHMPYMDGLTLIKAVRRMLPSAGIIISSGHVDTEESKKIKLLDIQTVLEKPFTQKMLTTALAAVLQPTS